MSDLRPDIAAHFRDFAVDCTVSPKGQSAIDTEGIWLDFDALPSEFREYTRRLFVLKKDEVPQVFRGDQIDAPEQRGASRKAWMVDEFLHSDNEVWRLVVHAGDPRES